MHVLTQYSIYQLVIILCLCHLVGDYVLQSNFIATTKGTNYYHLFVHCALYTLPFLICFGFTWQVLVIFVMHIIIDPLKATYNKISYPVDQIIHYLTLLIYFIH